MIKKAVVIGIKCANLCEKKSTIYKYTDIIKNIKSNNSMNEFLSIESEDLLSKQNSLMALQPYDESIIHGLRENCNDENT